MFNKIHEKVIKKLKYLITCHIRSKNQLIIFTNSLKLTNIHMKTCTSIAKLEKKIRTINQKFIITHSKFNI